MLENYRENRMRALLCDGKSRGGRFCVVKHLKEDSEVNFTSERHELNAI